MVEVAPWFLLWATQYSIVPSRQSGEMAIVTSLDKRSIHWEKERKVFTIIKWISSLVSIPDRGGSAFPLIPLSYRDSIVYV